MAKCEVCGKFDNWGDFVDGRCSSCAPISEESKEEALDFARQTGDADSATSHVLTTTLSQITGYEIVEEQGVIQGGMFTSKNALSDLGAGLKNLIGGELGAYTSLLEAARDEALKRLKKEAIFKGGNAVIGIQFSGFAMEAEALGINAYGTSVTVRPIESSETGNG